MPGCQLAGRDLQGAGYYGTLGCFARDRQSGELGFVTNQHVADHVGNTLYFPELHALPVGNVQRAFDIVAGEERFPGLVDQPGAYFRVDCAFATLAPELAKRKKRDIEPRLPVIDDAPGAAELRALGPTLPLDLDTMGPVGRKVLGVGRTRSVQRGTVVAFGYQWIGDASYAHYTDLLIVGESGGAFSDHGDSGKLIVTDDAALRPVALLWGGWQERLRHGREQENWTYGIDINKVLDLLGVEIVTAL